MDYAKLASKDSVDKTVKALEGKGYQVSIAGNGQEALEKIKSLIPQGASVMNGSSKTLEAIGYSDFLKSGQSGWNNLHAKVDAENDPEKRNVLRKEALMSDFYLGSVHAVTEDGQMIIASNSGSQIPHLAYTSPNIILVIGIQKIVPDLNAALTRLETYVFPQEDARMKEKGAPGSMISKILIFRNENLRIGRKINIIFINEKLGF